MFSGFSMPEIDQIIIGDEPEALAKLLSRRGFRDIVLLAVRANFASAPREIPVWLA
jgi:hypothetical protein